MYICSIRFTLIDANTLILKYQTIMKQDSDTKDCKDLKKSENDASVVELTKVWTEAFGSGKNGDVAGADISSSSGGSGSVNPSCMAVFDKFWLCGNPGNQLGYYYRYGSYEDCSRFMSDWRRCMQLKGTSDPMKRQILLDSMTPSHCGPGTGPFEIRDVTPVWDMKTEPSWTGKK